MDANSTSPVLSPTPINLDLHLSHGELAAVLMKHFGIHEGWYDVSFEIQIAIGKVGPVDGPQLPGGAMGIRRVGLNKVAPNTPGAVDAAEVNPVPARSAAKRARK